MSTVLLIVHVMIAAALIGVVLLQRSEGGALGIGGGGGGFMTGRGAANLLTRVTAGLAAAFFATSLLLSIIATRSEAPRSILDAPPAGVPGQPPGAPRPQGAPQSAPQSAPGLPQIDLNKIPDAPLPADPPKVPQSK
jgi:preprotein translocase subunit SecG